MDKFLEFLSGFDAQTIIAMTIILWYLVRDFKQELRADMKVIKENIDIQSARIEKQSERTDKLYEMFVDLLKDGKKK